MSHRSLDFAMPVPAGVVFEAFHDQHRRRRRDSLVSATVASGGAPWPHMGAVTRNVGGGRLRNLSIRAQFFAYGRPQLAAASLLGHSCSFQGRAASMRHRELDRDQSLLSYIYTLQAGRLVGPLWLVWIIRPFVDRIFEHEKLKRFGRLRAALAQHADETRLWQQEQ